MPILLVDLLLVLLLLLEPLGVLGLLHDDLDASSRAMQSVVDGIDELLRRIDGWASRDAALVISD